MSLFILIQQNHIAVKMNWLIPLFCILTITEASFLQTIGAYFGDLLGFKECKLTPIAFSTDNTSCGVRPKHCSDSYYRTIDGSCNNLEHGWWGTPLTPYLRLMKNNYFDGVHEFPKSKDKKELPNSREVSLKIYCPKDVDDELWTLGFMQYLQLIAHDMGKTAGVGQTRVFVACCSKGKPTEVAKTDNRCANIKIPKNDHLNYPEGRRCMNFYRTQTTKDRDDCICTTRVAEPLNNVTSFMDVSYLYGSDKEKLDAVREKKGGRLKFVHRYGQKYPPQVSSPTEVCKVKKKSDPCYEAGDDRINQNPQLAVLHIIYMIHHNNIADKLSKLNPHWDDEKIFQETRNIVIAVHQYVFYYEVLAFILGSTILEHNKIIYPGAKDFINDYDPSVNPGVSNEFSTAAYRLLHTLIKGSIHVYGNNTITVKKSIKLRDWMDNVGIIEGCDFLGYLRGLATQPADALDPYITDDVLNYLFKEGDSGLDLKATDVMRGRDHGLATYAHAIEKCCLGEEPQTFKDLEKYIDKKYVEILSKLYKSPKDVDLHVGISVEKRLPATICGPVSCCLIAEQFYRTRIGDRYYFENNQHKSAFNIEQLNAIRETSTFAMLMCQVPGIKKIQSRAFQQVSLINPLVSCSSIPTLDLSLWKEKKEKEEKKEKDEKKLDLPFGISL